MALKPEMINGPIVKGLDFGEVVLARICWSSDPDTGLKGDWQIHRGAWAENRFDIVTTKKLRMEEGEWRRCMGGHQ